MSDKETILTMLKEILNGESTDELNWETKKEFLFTTFKRVFGISELEKRMETQETHTKYGTIEQVLENIDKMKKTWDENIESFLKQVDDRFDKRDKEIAELRERQNKQFNMRTDDLLGIRTQLNELKEALDIHVNILSKHDSRFQNLYEVLRELIKFVQIKQMGCVSVELIKLLEKLEGKTEKKESLIKICPVCHAYCNGKHKKDSEKDSGGVKDTALDLEGYTKPAEPNLNGISRVDIQPSFLRKELIHPYEAEVIEFLQEQGKIVVKREDLQRWWNNSTIEEKEYITRAYGID